MSNFTPPEKRKSKFHIQQSLFKRRRRLDREDKKKTIRSDLFIFVGIKMMQTREWNTACKVYIGNLGEHASKPELEEVL